MTNQTIHPEITAHKFTLVDEQGRRRAVLDFSEGEPRLAFVDENGVPRVGVGFSAGEPKVVLFDEKQTLRARLVVRSEGAVLELFDGEGKLVKTMSDK
jgi:hypothetical protein